MDIIFEQEKSLETTFGIPAKARLYYEYKSAEELKKVISTEEFQTNEYFHIGEGSNVIFMNDYKGLVLHSAIKGIKRYDKDKENVYVIAGAGENWDGLVSWCVDNGLQGIENLAGIPGEVGAAAVQNIGAYGVEIKDFVYNVECLDTIENKIMILTRDECLYDYRDSFLKREGKGRYIVLRVSLKLRKNNFQYNLSYGSLQNLNKDTVSIKDIYDEVLKIRNIKLPDPAKIGNSGSFFKNPIVHWYYFEDMVKSKYPDAPSYPTASQYFVKVPAAWLIEKSGLSGYTTEGAKVYDRHNLVVINQGNATGTDVKNLYEHIIHKVRENFGITLQAEVNLINTEIEVTILGSGTSKGIPEVGCFCKTCRSEDAKDKRLRASAMIETMGTRLLIDVSPDFRQQALTNDITWADGLLITHSHYDHVGGIDDLRPFCATQKFPVFLKKDVNDDLHRRVDYCFKDELYPGVPTFKMNEIYDRPFYFKGIKIIPILVYHGKLPILGYRIGDFAYITDAKTIPEDQIEKLQGVKVLVINALRPREHFAHFSVDEALKIIELLKPQRAYLTHFCHEIGCHKELQAGLPKTVFATYDGMKIKVE